MSQPRLPRLQVAVLLLLALAGCEPPPATGPDYGQAPARELDRTYRLAVHPLHNPTKLLAAYQPLAERLQRELPGVRVEVEASRDYQDFERKFRARGPELLLPNPWQTLEAMKQGYSVLAMAGDAEDFHGIFLVRRDSGITEPEQLRGRVVAYPSPTALAACIMPQYWLHQRGIDVNRDLDNRYVGSQESAIMNAYLGQAAAGVTWSPPWRGFQKARPQEAAELTVAWQTPPLLNNSFMVRDDVPGDLSQALRRALLALDQDAEGRAVLAGMETARFHPATDTDYGAVRDYIERFEREVRPVEAAQPPAQPSAQP